MTYRRPKCTQRFCFRESEVFSPVSLQKARMTGAAAVMVAMAVCGRR